MKRLFLFIFKSLFLILLYIGFTNIVIFASEQENSNSGIINNAEIIENKENKSKVIKNLNAILVGSYKAKLDVILDNLKDNIKDESKENQIKTFSTILIPINTKIKAIETKKELGTNRKEVLLEVLKHIKNNLEVDIKELLNEK